MAHELLKFTLDLNNPKDFQPIMGSLDYGTFYMLYMKINSYKKKKKKNGIEVHCYDCDYKIQNYRGEITMGFADIYPKIDFVPESTTVEHLKGIDVTIEFKVGPFNTKTCINFVHELEKPLLSKHIVYAKYLRTSPPDCLYNPQLPKEAKYINPYRFERDGEDLMEISKRKYGDTSPFPIPIDLGVPDGFCIPNRTRIL